MSRWFAVGSLLLLASLGCSSAPSRVVAPPINPNAGPDAIAKADKNGDGGIDEAEAKANSPGLFEPGAKARFDTNGDGKITADEITARVDKWNESKIGLTQYSLAITIDGQPVEGATITLVPEEWLGTELKPGTGVTDATGRANITIAPGDLKPNEAGLQGMRLGVYKVQVTHPSMQLPAKLNTATEHGVEIAHDDIEIGRTVMPLTTR